MTVRGSRIGFRLLRGLARRFRGSAVGVRFVVQHDRVAGKDDKEAFMSFKLYSSQAPKEINIKMGYSSYAGIYDLSDQSLKLCIGMFPDTPRPTKFEANDDGQWAYVVLKREEH